MFENELRRYTGEQVQIVTPIDVISGILLSVIDGQVTVRTQGFPGYSPEDVTVNIEAISYVRVLV